MWLHMLAPMHHFDSGKPHFQCRRRRLHIDMQQTWHITAAVTNRNHTYRLQIDSMTKFARRGLSMYWLETKENKKGKASACNELKGI
jgi:hypothetical protein